MTEARASYLSSVPMRCGVMTKAGGPCQAYRMRNQGTCFQHSADPADIAARTDARSRGGRGKQGRQISAIDAMLAAGPLPEVDATAMLRHAQAVALALEPSLSQARVLGYLALAVSKVQEIGDLADRVTALEQSKGE